MAKKPITETDLRDLCERALDLGADLKQMSETIRATIKLDTSAQIQAAKILAALAARAADASHSILIVIALEEARVALEKQFRERASTI